MGKAGRQITEDNRHPAALHRRVETDLPGADGHQTLLPQFQALAVNEPAPMHGDRQGEPARQDVAAGVPVHSAGPSESRRLRRNAAHDGATAEGTRRESYATARHGLPSAQLHLLQLVESSVMAVAGPCRGD